MPAVVDKDRCEGAGDCIDVCPTEAITMQDGKAVVDEDLCGDCGVCEDACPHEAIQMQ